MPPLSRSSGGSSLKDDDSFRIVLIALRFAESCGVKPQVAHSIALTPPIPAAHKAAFANELFATWAFPLLSATLHQSRIVILHFLATGEVLRHPLACVTSLVMLVVAESGSGLMKRSEKPGNDPIFGNGISPA